MKRIIIAGLILLILITIGCEPAKRKYIRVNNPSGVAAITITQFGSTGSDTIEVKDKNDIVKFTNFISNLELRKMRPYEIVPVADGGGGYNIILLYDDKTNITYIQRNNEFFGEEGKVWYIMTYNQAERFNEIFRRIRAGFHLDDENMY